MTEPRTDIDLAADTTALDVGHAMNRVVDQSARTVAASLEVALAAQRAALAGTTYSLAVTRAALAFCVLGLALPLGGCPRFHDGRLTGAPADATFVEIDGVHVRYRDVGAGPAVVLVHGYGASSESWASVIPALTGHHRVIAVDLKGFGWTSRPDGDYSPAAQAHLVWRVLDRLGVKDVAIVGHSWGSSVSLSMAVAQPARVRRVALYSAYVYDDQVPSFFRWAEKPGLGEMLFGMYYRERIEDRVPLAYYDERYVTQSKVERVEAEMERPGTVAAALATARRHHFGPLHRALRAFQQPVLLLWGENDQVTPIRFGHRLVEELANAELKTYARCGHMPMVEAHNQSTRDLAAFLAKDLVAPPPPTDAGPAPADGTGGGAAETQPSTTSATAIADLDVPAPETSNVGVPDLVPASRMTIGADLAALGVELTPRRYAAPRESTEIVVHGLLRVREHGLFNLDLDRGLDSRGEPLFPVPLSGGQKINDGDIRARTDLALYARGVGLAVKARIDWLDNVSLGGNPDLSNGSPATSGGQRPTAVVLKRAWGEALTPFGTLAAGRMGAHFGLGIAAHGGDCEDCDQGAAADRIAFVSPIAGHLLAVAWDFASRLPFERARNDSHNISLDTASAVSGPTLAILKVHTPAARERRAAAGLTNIEYGGYVSLRFQDSDVPASYLPTAVPASFTPDDVVARGFSATATGAWARVSSERFRIEAELAYAKARIDQPSLVPGAEITVPVTSNQLGFALESDVDLGPAQLGFDGGFASGDDAPGFGAYPKPTEAAPPPGAFDGPQADLPRDRTVDNFRFHPDYRVDQILFRELIGTITDAIYVKPHVRAALLSAGAGQFELGASLIASWAVEAASTPSGARDLGIEVDPELRYAHADGFAATLVVGPFFPGGAFDNTNLQARSAAVVRGRVAWVF